MKATATRNKKGIGCMIYKLQEALLQKERPMYSTNRIIAVNVLKIRN